jgi:peptide/nickel transport system ATP-binding protein
MSTNTLHVQDLVISSAQGAIVRGVHFDVRPGMPLTILGDSGSGKSLVLQAIMGTLPPELTATGSVQLGNQNLLQLTARERRNLWNRSISLLPQEPWLALDPTMRVAAQVAEVHRHLYGRRPAQAQGAAIANLADVELADAANLYPFQMSGGMCQRAAIAISHAGASELLLCDEPTKSVDRIMRDGIVSRLKREVEANRLLITVTHDIAVARGLGGNIAIMRDGQFVETGAAHQILSFPQMRYTRELIEADPEAWLPVERRPFGDILISGRGLAKHYGRRTIFEGVDIDVHAGEVVAIVGPSGCGKTTLGNILLGLVKPDNGSVTRASSLGRLGAQKLYQDPPAAFAPRQILRRGLMDLARRNGFDLAEINGWMSRLKLPSHLLERRPDQVSGGELQRIALLRTLLLRPKFLFADEATSRLDPLGQRNVIEALLHINRAEAVGLLLVTHDPGLAHKVAHRTISLQVNALSKAA